MLRRERLKYEVDKLLARGSPVLVACLAAATTVVALVAGVAITRTGAAPGGQPLDTKEAVWASLMRALDPGTMGADQGWGFRGVMLAVTLIGIVLLSTLVSVITTAFEHQYDKLRRGGTWVMEKDHVVVLGWSEVVFAVVQQLQVSAQSQSGLLRVVLLSERDPLEAEDEIVGKALQRRKLRLLYRKGSPTNVEALKRVGVANAKSVIVVTPAGARTDDHALRTVLGVRRVCEDASRHDLPVAVELKSKQNMADLRLCAGVGRQKHLHIVKKNQLLARVIVQSIRHSGLSQVYAELLAFEGNEIYALEPPDDAGRTGFDDLALRLRNAVPIGVMTANRRCAELPEDAPLEAGDRLILRRVPAGAPSAGGLDDRLLAADEESRHVPARMRAWPYARLRRELGEDRVRGVLRQGRPELLPPSDRRLEAGERLIVVAQDANVTLELSSTESGGAEDAGFTAVGPPEAPENILVLGWNARGAQVVQDLEHYAPAGSMVEVVYDDRAVDPDAEPPCNARSPIEVRCAAGSTHTEAALEALDLPSRHRVIVLGYTEGLTREQADTRTLLTLQHMRNLLERCDPRPTIVSELLDQRNRELADIDGSDDFVVSDHLISLKLAQMAENACAREVLDELLSPSGSEIYMRRASLYAGAGENVSFRRLQRRARSRGEIVIGHRVHAERLNAGRCYGIHLNPSNKDEAFVMGPSDSVIVVADQ